MSNLSEAVPHLWPEQGTVDRPDWHAQANCGRNGIIGDRAEVRVRIMFPTRGQTADFAKSVCVDCPVAHLCFESNTKMDPRFGHHGVWGGQSGRQRRTAWQAEYRHGERRTYKVGCRCELCTEANTVYARSKR
jgi:hypothetical protein